MQNALVIAEKPDLARKIEASYQKHKSEIPYRITVLSQRGHLLETCMPDELDPSLKRWSWDTLPIYPENYGGWKYHVIKEKKTGNFKTSKERYDEIKRALSSGQFDFVIHAGDPDQEGELLVNMVLTQAKNKLPVKRFWTNDVTDTAIFHELQHLHDDEHDPMMINLLSAAYSRQHWDWLFGVNITRAASLKMNGMAACGRVKTTLLAIVVNREKEIANFVPQTVYGVQAEYAKGFNGILFNKADAQDSEYADEDQKAGVVWLKTRQEAEQCIAGIHGPAVVTDVESKHTKTYAPKLFKLSTLQMEAGKKGIDDALVLSTIQSLYEKTILSYPRTDCEYLSSNEDFSGILNAIAEGIPQFADVIHTITPADIARVRKSKRWINDAALKESGHSALRPTTTSVDFASLNRVEQFIYGLICQRFIGMFLPPLEQDVTTIVAEADGKTFRSSGKTTTSPGFASFFKANISVNELPPVRKGEVLDVNRYSVTTKTSTCPKRFTSNELIGVCENPARFLNDQSLRALGKRLKIGTPATRSGIIKVLSTPMDRRTAEGKRGDGYLTTRKEGRREVLVPTPSGTAIINNLNGLMITRVDMTGLWEERLEDVRKGHKTADELNQEMTIDLNNMLQEIKDHDMAQVNNNTRKGAPVETDLKCPVCGKPLLKFDWGWACSGYNREKPEEGCKFAFSRHPAKGTVSDEDFKALITTGRTLHPIQMKRKADNKPFEAYFVYKGGDKFELEFAEKPHEEFGTCPACGKPLIKYDWGWACSGRDREHPENGCQFAFSKHPAGGTVSDEDFMALITKGKTAHPIRMKRKSDGKPFEAYFVYKGGNKFDLEFVQKQHESFGTCPVCGKPIYESDKTYYCSGFKDGCNFRIWKSAFGHKLTKTEVQTLLKGETTAPIKDLRKWDKIARKFSGAKYTGSLYLDENNQIQVKR